MPTKYNSVTHTKMLNGLMTVGNFIAHAAEVVAQVALSLLNTAVSAVKSAVEAVKKVVECLKEELIKMVADMFNKVIKPVIDALRAYLANVGSKLEAIYDDYKAGKAPSREHIEALIKAILPPELMNFIIAMSIIYEVINIVVTFGVPGVGTIVSLGIGAAIGVAMTQYMIPNLDFLKGLCDGAQQALANDLIPFFVIATGLKNTLDGMCGIQIQNPNF